MAEENTLQAMADEMDRQIADADREAMRSQLALATGHFQEYWDGYVARAREGLEQAYDDVQSVADGGDREADG